MSQAADRCAQLFEPAALTQGLLEVEAALALARAEAGLQSWASARALQAAGRPQDPANLELLDTARLLQTRRALVLIEAEVFDSAECLLALADRHPAALPLRQHLARWLASLLGRIEPLRQAAAAALRLPWRGDAIVATLLGRNLGLAVAPMDDQHSLRAELSLLLEVAADIGAELAAPAAIARRELAVDVHAALVALHESLQALGGDAPRLQRPLAESPLDPVAAEQVLADWRHRLPHLQPRAYGHDDPRLPAD